MKNIIFENQSEIATAATANKTLGGTDRRWRPHGSTGCADAKRTLNGVKRSVGSRGRPSSPATRHATPYCRGTTRARYWQRGSRLGESVPLQGRRFIPPRFGGAHAGPRAPPPHPMPGVVLFARRALSRRRFCHRRRRRSAIPAGLSAPPRK